jgi:N-acetylmuramic acid 6-phosphate etherase
LHDRALRMLQDLTGLNRQESGYLLERSGRRVKLALLMHWTELGKEECDRLLLEHQGDLRSALQSCQKERKE